jgi:hypothetical protein
MFVFPGDLSLRNNSLKRFEKIRDVVVKTTLTAHEKMSNEAVAKSWEAIRIGETRILRQ